MEVGRLFRHLGPLPSHHRFAAMVAGDDSKSLEGHGARDFVA